MHTERLENTASLPVNVRQREGRQKEPGILTPLNHSFVIGVSWTIVAMLFFLTLSIAVAEDSVISESAMTVIFLASLAAGVVSFTLAYIKRDEWLRSTSQTGTMTPQYIGQVHQLNDTSPDVSAPALPGVDDILRVSGSLLIRLQVPPELGITNQHIMNLAFRIADGDLSWSRRALRNVIPENAYTEFSDILVDREVLRNAPNNSYALTQNGVDLFCNVVVTGAPPPTTTT